MALVGSGAGKTDREPAAALLGPRWRTIQSTGSSCRTSRPITSGTDVAICGTLTSSMTRCAHVAGPAEADEAAIRRALEQAALADFVESLPGARHDGWRARCPTVKRAASACRDAPPAAPGLILDKATSHLTRSAGPDAQRLDADARTARDRHRSSLDRADADQLTVLTAVVWSRLAPTPDSRPQRPSARLIRRQLSGAQQSIRMAENLAKVIVHSGWPLTGARIGDILKERHRQQRDHRHADKRRGSRPSGAAAAQCQYHLQQQRAGGDADGLRRCCAILVRPSPTQHGRQHVGVAQHY